MNHVFVAACCLYCGADDHDVDLPDACEDRTPDDVMTYTTETGKAPVSPLMDVIDHAWEDAEQVMAGFDRAREGRF